MKRKIVKAKRIGRYVDCMSLTKEEKQWIKKNADLKSNSKISKEYIVFVGTEACYAEGIHDAPDNLFYILRDACDEDFEFVWFEF